MKSSKLYEETKDYYQMIPSTNIDEPVLWKCLKCDKILTTEQGAMTHVQSHLFTINNSINNEIQIICDKCGKICSNNEALFQHNIGKHGMFDVALTSIQEEQKIIEKQCEQMTISTELHTCVVCGWTFNSLESLNDHMTNGWQPKDKLKSFNCDKCKKEFVEERALRQHRNYCESR